MSENIMRNTCSELSLFTCSSQADSDDLERRTIRNLRVLPNQEKSDKDRKEGKRPIKAASDVSIKTESSVGASEDSFNRNKFNWNAGAASFYQYPSSSIEMPYDEPNYSSLTTTSPSTMGRRAITKSHSIKLGQASPDPENTFSLQDMVSLDRNMYQEEKRKFEEYKMRRKLDVQNLQQSDLKRMEQLRTEQQFNTNKLFTHNPIQYTFQQDFTKSNKSPEQSTMPKLQSTPKQLTKAMEKMTISSSSPSPSQTASASIAAAIGTAKSSHYQFWRNFSPSRMNYFAMRLEHLYRLKYMQDVEDSLPTHQLYKKLNENKIEKTDVRRCLTILFVDLDNWGAFFKSLTDSLPENVFVLAFKSAASGWTIPSNNTYYKSLNERGLIKIYTNHSNRPDSLGIMITLQIGKLHTRLPTHISFLVISGDKSYLDLLSHFKNSKRMFGVINPHYAPIKSKEHESNIIEDGNHLLDLVKEACYLSYKFSRSKDFNEIEYQRYLPYDQDRRYSLDEQSLEGADF